MQEDPLFVKSLTYYLGGAASQYTFAEPTIDRAYCPILSHQITNLQVNGLPSATNSEAQFNCLS